MASATGRRIALALGGALLALLVAEGALSLGTGRSLRRLGGEPEIALRAWRAPTDAQLAAAAEAAHTPGLYRVHEDPMVGLVFARDAELTIRQVPFSTDGLGLRRRSGPPPPPGAFEVVVLGDSVAFGFGLPDDAVLATRLERRLEELLPPEAPPVVARTVAVPGWSHRNAVHFLLDHWDELACDLVLVLPIENDLIDSYSVYASGHRRNAFDIAAHDPMLRVGIDKVVATALGGLHHLQDEGRLKGFRQAHLGPLALTADLSPESWRRYDENVDSLLALEAFLAARDVPLVTVLSSQMAYSWGLLERLHRAGSEAPIVPLFTRPPEGWDLGDNPHPNATSVDVMAGWIVEALIEGGLVPGAAGARAVAPAPPAYEAARAPVLGPADWVRERASSRAGLRQRLRATIRPAEALGLLQVYAGLHRDGSLDRRALVLLPRGDGTLRLALSPLPGRADLLPLQVDVSLDGVAVGSLVLDGRRVSEATFPVPDGEWPVEVGLSAARAVPVVLEGRTVMASCVLERMATEDAP